MRKITIGLLMFSFLFGATMALPVGAEELEKISSPDQLKYYRVMKKENGVLFGVKLKTKDQLVATTTSSEKLEKIPSLDQLRNFKMIKKENGSLFGIRIREDNNESSDDRADDSDKVKVEKNKSRGDLEKISSPSLISMYENIKKVGNALWGTKKQAAKSTTSNSAQKRVVVKSEAVSCVQAAISTKDAALIENIKEAADLTSVAISARSNCQKSALSLTDGQFAATDVCLKAFRESVQKMQKEQKADHQKIWATYRAALKTCQPASTTNNSEELIVEDGGESLDSLLSEVITHEED